MIRLTTSKAAAFSDATIAFFGDKPRSAPRTGEKIYRASVGVGNDDVGGGSRGRVRSRARVRDSLGSRRRSRLIVPTTFL